MERRRTMRAYSAGGVVFRLVPVRSAERREGVEIALVGRSHAGIWALPKGTPKPGETIEQVAIREVQEETGLKVRMMVLKLQSNRNFGRFRYTRRNAS